MHYRLRLMMGATALLYLGPLLAGLGGFGWRIVPVFAAIFLLWTLIMRPSSWPQTRTDWTNPKALIIILGQSVMQVLLVTVCFGIGRGLGGVLGALPPFHPALPIAISFLSIPLCRMLWDPATAEATDRFLHKALAEITAASSVTPPDRSDARVLTARLLAPVHALPAKTPDAEISRHLAAIAVHADPADMHDVLLAAARSGTASVSGLHALILHATNPALTGRLAGCQAPAHAFDMIASDPALTLLYAQRSTAQLRHDPAACRDSVSAQNLRSAAAQMPPELATALTSLATLTDTLCPSAHGSDRQNAGT